MRVGTWWRLPWEINYSITGATMPRHTEGHSKWSRQFAKNFAEGMLHLAPRWLGRPCSHPPGLWVGKWCLDFYSKAPFSQNLGFHSSVFLWDFTFPSATHSFLHPLLISLGLQALFLVLDRAQTFQVSSRDRTSLLVPIFGSTRPRNTQRAQHRLNCHATLVFRNPIQDWLVRGFNRWTVQLGHNSPFSWVFFSGSNFLENQVCGSVTQENISNELKIFPYLKISFSRDGDISQNFSNHGQRTGCALHFS